MVGVVVGGGGVEEIVGLEVVVGRSVVVTVVFDSRVQGVCVHLVMVVLVDVVLVTDVVVVEECAVVGVVVGVDDCRSQETRHIAEMSAVKATITLNRAATRRIGMLPTILCVLR
jgi:hypothetical protein